MSKKFLMSIEVAGEHGVQSPEELASLLENLATSIREHKAYPVAGFLRDTDSDTVVGKMGIMDSSVMDSISEIAKDALDTLKDKTPTGTVH
jgi:hypothetical protein